MNRRTLPFRLLPIVALLATGCQAGPVGEKPSLDTPIPVLRLDGYDPTGQFIASWQTDVPRVHLIKGSQGSQHVWVKVRARGVPAGKATLWLWAVDESTGQELSRTTLTCKLAPEGPWLACPRQRIEFEYPCWTQGTVVRLHARLRTTEGPGAETTARLSAGWYGECYDW